MHVTQFACDDADFGFLSRHVSPKRGRKKSQQVGSAETSKGPLLWE